MHIEEILERLVSFPSVSRDSNFMITDYLENLCSSFGATCERVNYLDQQHVPKSNLIAKFGKGTGGVVYCGHTDVVPADTWNYNGTPFQLTIQDDKYYGRGSCDMKGSIACFLSVLFSMNHQGLKKPVYLIITADEEVGYHGASKVVEQSSFYREMVQHQTFGIIGEPTQCKVVYAHKGVCGIKVTSHGIAAHSSTNLGKNANLNMIPFLQEMKAIYDQSQTESLWKNNEFDPPEISLNIGINDYTYARNITPGISICTLFFRPVPGFDFEPLIERIQTSALKQGLQFEIESLAHPMHRPAESEFVKQCLSLTNNTKPQTVSYGTDGAMFKELLNLMVFGPGSIMQAHTDDEFITKDQLESGREYYRRIIRHFCE